MKICEDFLTIDCQKMVRSTALITLGAENSHEISCQSNLPALPQLDLRNTTATIATATKPVKMTYITNKFSS